MKVPFLIAGAMSFGMFVPIAPAQIIFDDFSTDTTANYTQTSGRQAFTYSGSDLGPDGAGGRLNSALPPGLSDNSDPDSAFTNINSFSGFSLNSVLTVSTDFLTSPTFTDEGGNLVLVGFATSNSGFNNGNTAWAMALRADDDALDADPEVEWFLRARASGTGNADGINNSGDEEIFSAGKLISDFSADTWYTLEMTLEYVSGDDWLVSGRIFATAGGADILSIAPTTQSNFALDPSADLYAGFGTRVHNEGATGTITGGFIAADNLRVIPEPSALALLLGALGTLVLFRRRR